MAPKPSGSASRSRSLLPLTPSNFSSQCSKPGPASSCPERTSPVRRVPGDDRLCASATGRRSDAQDVAHRLFPSACGERGDKLLAVGEHFGGELDQRRDRKRAGACRAGPARRRELERADAATPGVAESLDRVEAVWAAPLSRQPGVDEGLPVAVGQGVGKEAGQAVEAVGAQGRERVRARAQGHRQGRHLDAAGEERSVVLEDCGSAGVDRDRSDGAAPEAHLGERAHASSPHFQGPRRSGAAPAPP